MPNNVKTQKSKFMFSERIKELRIQNQMPQRQLAAALDIDTATYCKIEKGERRAKREQISILSKLFNVKYGTVVDFMVRRLSISGSIKRTENRSSSFISCR